MAGDNYSHKSPLYRELLIRSGFNVDKRNYLIDGFTNGFDIGYRGPIERQDTARNIPIVNGVGSETEMWNKLLKEVKLGRHAGPFSKIPFKYFIQSPIGLVLKAENQTRLIFHLSFDFGEEIVAKSFNFHTPDEICSVKYKDLDYAVKTILGLITGGECDSEADCPDLWCDSDEEDDELQWGKSDGEITGSEHEHTRQYSGKDMDEDDTQIRHPAKVLKTVYMSKSDLKSAFRILPGSCLS